jgi:hypothetical protein
MSAAASWLSFRLDRSYSRVLERNLVQHAVRLRAAEAEDSTTRNVLMRLPAHNPLPTVAPPAIGGAPAVAASAAAAAAEDMEMKRLAVLRSGDPRRIRTLLRETGLLDPILVPQTIMLLGRDDVYKEAYAALSRSVFRIAGQLVDCLLDETQGDDVRARIPRLLALSDSHVAWDGLFTGLGDKRFELRYRCGRALDTMLQRHPEFKPDPAEVYKVIAAELTVSRRAWETRTVPAEGEEDSRFLALDRILQERASQSLSYIFTLLSLALPREAVHTAFRALHTDDTRLRALALEFLESSLPRELREPLSAHLEAPALAARKKGTAHTDAPMQTLIDSSPSITARLEEMGFKAAGDKRT